MMAWEGWPMVKVYNCRGLVTQQKDITDMTDRSVNQGLSQISWARATWLQSTNKEHNQGNPLDLKLMQQENKLRPHILFFKDTLCTHKGEPSKGPLWMWKDGEPL